jgi:HAMP domain-containing protein
MLLFVALEGGVALWGLNQIKLAVDHTQGDTEVAFAATELRRVGETSLEPVREYLLTGDPDAATRFEVAAEAMHASVHELSLMLGGSGGTHVHDHEGDLMHEAEESWHTVEAGALEILAEPDPVGSAEAIAKLQSLEPAAQRMLALLESIHHERLQDADRSRATAAATIVQMIIFAIGATLLAATSGMIAALVISRRISRPVVAMTITATNISKGDLDTSLQVDTGGEIGELADAIERMRMSLKLMFAKLNREQRAANDTSPGSRWMDR